MLDLNDAGEQQEFTGGAIPPKSIVLVRMTVRSPKVGAEGSHPLLSMSQNGLEYLSCEFEVASGKYTGHKLWENFGIFGHTEGQMKNVEISKRKLRAIVEAAAGIQPKDQSPAAMERRKLKDPQSLQGLLFGIKVGCAKPKAGDKYVNNNILLVVTPDHEAYATVMNGGEFISDEPLPEILHAAGGAAPPWTTPVNHQKPAPSAAPTAWGAPPANSQQQPAQQAQQAQPQQAVASPNWAQPAQAQPAAQAATSYGAVAGQQSFPANAAGMDQLPF